MNPSIEHMSDELKGCPWCDEAPATQSITREVRCFQHTQWMSLDAWNTRAETNAERALKEAKDTISEIMHDCVDGFGAEAARDAIWERSEKTLARIAAIEEGA